MKLTIVTVCYNSSLTIVETINSVNYQSYSDIEHIFIDGGSTDNTIDLIKSNSKIPNIILSEKDNGIYDAMNKGIAISNGNFIMTLNSDDILYDIKTIENIMYELKKFSLDAVYGNISFFKHDPNKTLRLWKSSKYVRDNVSKGWHPPHPGLTISKEYFDKVGSFNSNLRNNADYDFMLRLFKFHDLRIKYVDNIIVNMRIGGASTTIKGVFISFFENITVLKCNNYSIIQIVRILVYRYFSKLKQYIIK